MYWVESKDDKTAVTTFCRVGKKYVVRCEKNVAQYWNKMAGCGEEKKLDARAGKR
jgi:hypothetical protein